MKKGKHRSYKWTDVFLLLLFEVNGAIRFLRLGDKGNTVIDTDDPVYEWVKNRIQLVDHQADDSRYDNASCHIEGVMVPYINAGESGQESECEHHGTELAVHVKHGEGKSDGPCRMVTRERGVCIMWNKQIHFVRDERPWFEIYMGNDAIKNQGDNARDPCIEHRPLHVVLSEEPH